MFRLIVLLLLGLGAAAPSFAADYEINLSALDALGASDAEPELPLPVIKSKAAPAKKIQPRKTPSVKVKKSVEPVVRTRTETIVRKPAAESPEAKAQENGRPAVKEEPKSAPVSAPVEDKTPSAASLSPDAGNTPPEEKASPAETAAPAAEPAFPTVEKPAAFMPAEKPGVVKNAAPEAMASVSSLSGRSALLVFDEESAELNAGIVGVLTKMAESLEPENAGKITIEAYNHDGGEGSFSRKRLSLSRAVTVRSWLLGKGFKSFGIKIINTEDGALRNNIQVSF